MWYRKGIYYAGFDESQFNFELQDIHREQVGFQWLGFRVHGWGFRL